MIIALLLTPTGSEVRSAGLPLSFLSLAYVHHGVYFLAYCTPRVSILGVFVWN